MPVLLSAIEESGKRGFILFSKHLLHKLGRETFPGSPPSRGNPLWKVQLDSYGLLFLCDAHHYCSQQSDLARSQGSFSLQSNIPCARVDDQFAILKF